MKKFFMFLLVCMLAFTLVACNNNGGGGEGGGEAAEGPDEIRIGVIGPLTGAGAQYGAAMKEAAELAAEEINNGGGINGAKIVLFEEDDASTPAQAVSAAEKLITQNEVHFIVGNYNSSCSLAVMEVTAREQVPHINPISTAAAITESGSKFIFRNCATNPMQVGTVTRYLFDNLDGKKYAVINENTDYGIGMLEAFQEVAKGYSDIEIVATEAYNAGDTDFMAQLTKIKNAAPDVLFCASNITEGSQIYKQAHSLGMDSIIKYTMGGCSTPAFFDLSEKTCIGNYCSSYFEASNQDPLVVTFVNAYVAKWGHEPDMFAAATYEAVYLAKAAVEKAEYAEDLAAYRVALADGLRALNAEPGVQGGPTTFDATGQAEKSVLVVQWQEDGTKKIVQDAK